MRRPRLLAWSFGLALALVVAPAGPASAQKKGTKGTPVKVLLLSGGQRNHHGYRDQALHLSDQLEDTGRYEVTICEDAALVETPALAKYDLVIVPVDRRDAEFGFTEAQQKVLLEYVRAGHGYVSIHGGDNAATPQTVAPAWSDDFRDMLGGIFSHHGTPDSKTKKGSFTVKIVDTSSPITRGVPDFDLKDELYYKLQMRPDVQPLATVDFDGGTWPVAWTRTYGKGRVFHTPLGHRDFGPGKDDPLQNPHLAKLILQGIDWIAEGKTAAPK